MTDTNAKALYVHIPFCVSICGYCDFAKCKYDVNLANRYLEHLFKEIDQIKQNSFQTIYIGGGTPSCLNDIQLKLLLEKLTRFSNVIEYTFEINPETFSLSKAELLKEYGINRVSIGVQSFNEDLLEHMGRTHKNVDVINTFKYLDEVGITNRSIDLIFGFNIQTMDMLKTDLEIATSLNIKHISIYDLEIWPKTIFGFNHYKKNDDEKCAQMYEFIINYLNEKGYHQYEVSNFSLEGFESKHNKTYWHYDDYYGVGLSASGKIGNYRYTNTKNFVKYLNDEYVEEQEQLSKEDVLFEAIMMGLRIDEGINITLFNNKYDCDLLKHFSKAVKNNIEKGLLAIENNYLKTTKKGMYVLNDILVDFMDYIC